MANSTALEAWKDITPLARNEFICWVEDAKQEGTRDAAFAGPRKSSRRASAGPVAGRGASTASAPADSRVPPSWVRGRPAADPGETKLPWEPRS